MSVEVRQDSLVGIVHTGGEEEIGWEHSHYVKLYVEVVGRGLREAMEEI